MNDICEYISECSSVTSADIKGVLEALTSYIRQGIILWVQRGTGRIGTFLAIGKSKEVTDQKGNTKSSASIHGVNFRCSPRLKEMVKKNAPILVKRENLPKTGIEGRKAKVLSYLERNSYINLTDYAGLNNCTRYRASEDIKQFIKDNVIASVGYRTHRIYVLPEKEDEAKLKLRTKVALPDSINT